MTPKLMHLRFLAGHIFITNYQSIQINRQLFFLKKKKKFYQGRHAPHKLACISCIDHRILALTLVHRLVANEKNSWRVEGEIFKLTEGSKVVLAIPHLRKCTLLSKVKEYLGQLSGGQCSLHGRVL